MAFTVTSSPDNITSAYNQVIWDVVSDRNAGQEIAVTGFTPLIVIPDQNTSYILTVASHPYEVGDVLEFQDDFPSTILHGLKGDVTNTTATTITIVTDLPFNVTPTTEAGTIKRTNEDFKVRADVYKGIGEEFNFLTVTNNGGFASFDTGAHTYSTGDTIIVEGSTNYDGFHTVTATGGTSVLTSTAFIATDTGDLIKVNLLGSKRQQAITISGADTFRFNISNFLSTVLTQDLVTIGTGTSIVSPTLNSITNYTVYFEDEFSDRKGLITEGDNLFTSITKKAVNTTLQRREPQDLTFYTQDAASKRFLTHIPNGETIMANEVVQLSFLTTSITNMDARVDLFSSAGALLQSVAISGSLIQLNRGVVNVNTTPLLILQPTTAEIEIYLEDTGSNQMSEKKRFKINKNCVNPVEFWFLNRKGGMDTYTFTQTTQEGYSIKKETYERGLPKDFTVSDRGTDVIGSRVMEMHKATSGLVRNATAQWLGELMYSKEVYIKEYVDDLFNDVYFPVVVTGRKATTHDSENMIELEIEYMLPDLVVNG